MTNTVTITIDEYNEYLKLKQREEEEHNSKTMAEKSLEDLKKGKVYNL